MKFLQYYVVNTFTYKGFESFHHCHQHCIVFVSDERILYSISPFKLNINDCLLQGEVFMWLSDC